MKKTLTAGGAVIALVLMPGVSSAATFSAVPVAVSQADFCATDTDGGTKPIDEDTGQPVDDESGDGTGTDDGTDDGSDTGDGTANGGDGTANGGDGTANGGDGTANGGGTGGAGTGSTDGTTNGSGSSSAPSNSPNSFTAGRAALPAQQDCSEALTPGSDYSDEDGDGEPEKVDGVDDDRDGQVDEIDKKSQVSTIPDGGAETGDGSTGGALGMTLGGAGVLALLGGLAVWIRRATSRL